MNYGNNLPVQLRGISSELLPIYPYADMPGRIRSGTTYIAFRSNFPWPKLPPK